MKCVSGEELHAGVPFAVNYTIKCIKVVCVNMTPIKDTFVIYTHKTVQINYAQMSKIYFVCSQKPVKSIMI